MRTLLYMYRFYLGIDFPSHQRLHAPVSLQHPSVLPAIFLQPKFRLQVFKYAIFCRDIIKFTCSLVRMTLVNIMYGAILPLKPQ